MTSETLKPCDAKTLRAICKLPASYIERGDYSILVDETGITLTNQPIGEKPVESITLPRAVFDKFVKWYQTEQKVSKR